MLLEKHLSVTELLFIMTLRMETAVAFNIIFIMQMYKFFISRTVTTTRFLGASPIPTVQL